MPAAGVLAAGDGGRRCHDGRRGGVHGRCVGAVVTTGGSTIGRRGRGHRGRGGRGRRGGRGAARRASHGRHREGRDGGRGDPGWRPRPAPAAGCRWTELLQLGDVARELGDAGGFGLMLGFLRDLGLRRRRRGAALDRAARQRELVGDRRRGRGLLVVDACLDLARGLAGTLARLHGGHATGETLAIGREVGALRLDDLARFFRSTTASPPRPRARPA